MEKLSLLKKYIEIQSENESLWFPTTYRTEDYLQNELRKISWMIEVGTEDQIKNIIETKIKGEQKE